MSFLEAVEERDAELLKQIKDQEEPEKKEEVVEPEEKEEEPEIEEAEVEEEAEDEELEDEPEEVEDDEDDGPKEKAKKGWKVRQELKEAKQRADDLEKKFNEMSNTLQTAGITPEQIALARQQQQTTTQQQQQAADPEPDKELDRDNWHDWQIRQLQGQIKKQDEDIQAQKQGAQILQAKQEFQQIETAYTKEFAQYGEAKEFLKTSYKNELKLQYPQATDAQLNLDVDRQELILAGNAVNGGMNPAEAVKRMAEARGYVAQKEIKKQKPSIAKMAQNQKRSVNMINRSGETKKEKLNANDVLEMSFDDRIKMSNKDWDDTEVPYNWGQ